MTTPLYLGNSAAHDILNGALISWVAIEILLRLRNLGGKNALDWSLVAMVGAVVLAVNLGFAADHRLGGALAGGWFTFGAGIVLLVVGTLYRFWAILTLGRYFKFTVSIQEGHRVISSGPYRYLRHPSYSGLLLALLGFGIGLQNWLSVLALTVIPLAAVLIRIHVEEIALCAALGEDYRRYAASTRRLVPWLW